VAKGDGEGAARLMMERSREQHHVDPAGFQRDMGKLVNTVTASSFTCAQVRLRLLPTHSRWTAHTTLGSVYISGQVGRLCTRYSLTRYARTSHRRALFASLHRAQ